MHFEQDLATFEFLATKMKRDHIAEQPIGRSNYFRICESLLADGRQDLTFEYLRPFVAANGNRSLFRPVFVVLLRLQRFV